MSSSTPANGVPETTSPVSGRPRVAAWDSPVAPAAAPPGPALPIEVAALTSADGPSEAPVPPSARKPRLALGIVLLLLAMFWWRICVAVLELANVDAPYGTHNGGSQPSVLAYLIMMVPSAGLSVFGWMLVSKTRGAAVTTAIVGTIGLLILNLFHPGPWAWEPSWRVWYFVPMVLSIALLACWLIARSRPGLAYVLLVVPVAANVVLYILSVMHGGPVEGRWISEFGGWGWTDSWRGLGAWGYLITDAVIVAIKIIVMVTIPAWIASKFPVKERAPRPQPVVQASPTYVPMVTADGQSVMVPVAAPTGSADGRTNTMAIVAFVCSFVVSIVAIILGHVALAQIKRTGEDGRGFAVAALVLGYIGLVGGLAVAIYYILLWSRLLAAF